MLQMAIGRLTITQTEQLNGVGSNMREWERGTGSLLVQSKSSFLVLYTHTVVW